MHVLPRGDELLTAGRIIRGGTRLLGGSPISLVLEDEVRRSRKCVQLTESGQQEVVVNACAYVGVWNRGACRRECAQADDQRVACFNERLLPCADPGVVEPVV